MNFVSLSDKESIRNILDHRHHFRYLVQNQAQHVRSY